MLTVSYIIYLSLSIVIAIWVGQTLSRNGRVFLVENFEGNEALADSVNHLLLVGFYLINFGFISLALKYGDKPETIHQVIEFLSTKIGLVIMLLGAMHFFNMRALIKFRHFKWMAPAKGKEEACAA
ncbi:MAG: hypothetical protein LW823_01230 [Rickettsiales bacterium]|jgi:hypothetical protein|nr:hypothetical protein [Rickettsiales bacterium]